MKVVICDDQAIIRDGLEMLLKLEKDIEVLGQAQDGTEAVALVEKTQPDLVLMDLKMPGLNGIEATRHIRTHYPNVKVLVLTTYDDDEWVFDAIRAGAVGYLLKDMPRDQIIAAIEEHDGERAGELAIAHWELSRADIESFITPEGMHIPLGRMPDLA